MNFSGKKEREEKRIRVNCGMSLFLASGLVSVAYRECSHSGFLGQDLKLVVVRRHHSNFNFLILINMVLELSFFY